uniref:Lipocalin n=1 Tax=Rhipicephalus appendiculatus TaxID=34631 RepID=A0A131YER5_RHIAP
MLFFLLPSLLDNLLVQTCTIKSKCCQHCLLVLSVMSHLPAYLTNRSNSQTAFFPELDCTFMAQYDYTGRLKNCIWTSSKKKGVVGEQCDIRSHSSALQ